MGRDRFLWVVEVLYRGRLFDVTRPMSLGSARVYYDSFSLRYPFSDGYRLRLVGYQNIH